MDDIWDDLRCLPDDFVQNSRPSQAIERLYRKREDAENKSLEKMEAKRTEIFEKYKKIVAQESDELRKRLNDIKILIKNELLDSKLKANYENARNLEKTSFTIIFKTIQDYTRKRHDLVEEFYTIVVSLEKEKSNDLKEILKEAYGEIKKISFKLPSQYDECIELEIEKINQTILCNQRNYVELKNHLQLEIENDCKNFIEELRYVKEGWVKYLRNQTDKAISNLRSQNFKLTAQNNAEITKNADMLKSDAQEISTQMDNVSSAIKLKQAKEWLKSVRHTLCKLDTHSQKIIAVFKQAAVLIFNRFFQELKVTADQIGEMIAREDIVSIQCEMYTPTLEEIRNIYNADLELIQRVWNDLIEELSRTVDNTYQFLLAGATLWESHFKRTETFLVVVLKDVDNAIIANNAQSEPYEMKLNILIDTLRQEPSKEKLHKTLEDIKKLLFGITEMYKSQYQTEIGVFKKYKSTQEFKVDILLAEMKRFLAVYPPDLEKDPKIQRKRASWTSEIRDSTEGLIPNQMIFCKYQIDAVANWQFGLWEAITNYMSIAKTEIMAEAEKWVKMQCVKLDKRLEVRLAIHSLRLENIQSYIYDIRLEELCLHQKRFEEHKIASEKRANDLKEVCTECLKKFREIFEKYAQDLTYLKNKCAKLHSSALVNGQKAILKAKTEESIEEINSLVEGYMQESHFFFEKVKISNIKFSENMRMFNEGGNFAIQETKDYLKLQTKIEAQLQKNLTSAKKDIELGREKVIAAIEARNEEVLNFIQLVREEHEFKENIQKKMLSIKRELRKEVCVYCHNFKQVVNEIHASKINLMANCGNNEYFYIFKRTLEEKVEEIKKLGKYLYHPIPIILYSDKSSISEPISSTHNYPITDDQHYTEMLFNLKINDEEDSFAMNLNKVLFRGWKDIMTYAQGFYTSHTHQFHLDESTLHHSLSSLSKEFFFNFLNFQNQCETKWIQDVQQFLEFLRNFLTFAQDYMDAYFTEHRKICVQNFESFFDKEMRQPVAQKKKDVKELFRKLQKKLKPLHGHPNNRRFLEKLEIEAKIAEMEARDILDESNLPSTPMLKKMFDVTSQNIVTMNNLIPEVEDIPNPLNEIEKDLFLQLTGKVKKLKEFLTLIEDGEINESSRASMKHFKSFLASYEQVLDNSAYRSNDPIMAPFITCKSDKTTSTKSMSLTKTTGESTLFLYIDGNDGVQIELEDIYKKYVNEIEAENFDIFIEKLMKEWNNDVRTVLNLYKVEYDK